MPPQAVQPYLGGSSEQRFNTDLVLYVEAEEVVVVAVSMVTVGGVLWLFAKKSRSWARAWEDRLEMRRLRL